MQHKTIGLRLYAERLSVAFASDLFLLLPLYFKANGKTAVLFGQMSSIGAIGTLLCVTLGTYGLVYRLIQAQATNHAPYHLQPRTPAYFSSSYLAAGYLFPYFSAETAVRYGNAVLLIVAIGLELLLGALFYSASFRRSAIFATK